MNEREFSQRVRNCREKLWRISYAMLRNGADCDDALQEALLRAWRQIGSLREERYFETWLTRILINEAKRILKKRMPGAGELNENTQVQNTANPALHDAIMALPVSLRLPLVLHYMEGYAVKEVADMLKLPVTTVQWRLHSARVRIRDDWN